MISAQLALLLLTTPCQSAVAHQPAETVAVMCPVPEVQGPPAPVAEKPVVKPAKAKVHREAKKHKKRRRRRG